MLVETSHHIDAGEQDADGLYDYYYEYDVYRFIDGEATLVARSYLDEPDAAHLLRIEEAGVGRLLAQADLARPLVSQALDHLRQLGKRKLSWLSGRGDTGYETILA